jgi:succinoglycan biosynthesis transport protein ExoP
MPSSPVEYTGLFQRRKWWILCSVFTISSAVAGVSLILPKNYRSETLILVEPQKIPEDYVRATVTSDATDRLQTISEEIMSRTRLETIIHDLNLYPDLQGKKSGDEIVATMRKDITVDVITDAHPEKHSVGAFKIAYVAPTPLIARQVTQEIADLYIEENLRVRTQQAVGTNQFIDNEVIKARSDLEEQEAKIKQFNAEHLGALPEQEQSNLQLIGQYQSLSQANNEAIDRATQQRAYLQSMLNISGPNKGSIPSFGVSGTQTDLEKKRQELAEAEQRYTDAHPDVIRLKREVMILEQAAHGQPRESIADVPPGSDMPQQLRSQLVAIQQEIKSRSAREIALEARIRGLQERIAIQPEVQSQFADLNRDYQAMQKNYQSLEEKSEASGMAAQLESHNESEQFRIIDAADLPSRPYSPNLLIINGAGLLVSMMTGMLLALFAELRDSTIHDSDELERYLSIPLVAAIPKIRKSAPRKRGGLIPLFPNGA